MPRPKLRGRSLPTVPKIIGWWPHPGVRAAERNVVRKTTACDQCTRDDVNPFRPHAGVGYGHTDNQYMLYVVWVDLGYQEDCCLCVHRVRLDGTNHMRDLDTKALADQRTLSIIHANMALLMATDPTIRGYSIMIQHVVVNSEYHYVSV